MCSVNLFKNAGCGREGYPREVTGAQRHTLPPHIYTLVDMCYTKMMAEQQSQSILISGESGAGKTEAMKISTYLGDDASRGVLPDVREQQLLV